MGSPLADPWRSSLAVGLVLFTLAVVFGLVVGPRPAPAATAQVVIPVASGADDAEELSTGWLDVASSDLELVDEKVSQTVGLRFAGIPVPPGATITAAAIQFAVDEPGSGAAALVIAAEDTGDALPFSTGARITTRTRTTVAVPWTPPPWPTVGTAGDDQRTPDLAAVLQAVVDRPDWVAGNAVVLIVSGTGTRTAESFEGGRPPVLTVTWDDPATKTTTTIGTTTSAPTSTTTGVSSTTTTTPATTTTTTTTTLPPTGETVFVTAIGSGADDVEEISNGWLYATSSDLELVEDIGAQAVGLRFTGIAVPRNAVVTRAWVQFTVDETTTAPASLTIALQDAGDATRFTGNRGVSSRGRTASVDWVPDAWTAPGSSLDAQQTPDLAPLVQAVIDRSDWSAGNALAVVITGSGRRTASAFEGGSPPVLHIAWLPPTTGDPDPDPDPVNTAPSVIATATATVAGTATTLEAQIVDDGLPDPPAATTVLWEQIAGPAAATIADPAAATTTVLLPVAGEYHFRATVSDGALVDQAIAAAIASPAATSSTHLAVIGDYGNGSVRQGLVATMIANAGVDAVVTVGDNVYSSAGFDRLVGRYYHDFIGGYSGSYGSGSPTNRFFPALGNHDYQDVGLPGYLAFFDLPGSGVASTHTSGNERYYDARVGDVHLFIVNSNPQETDGLTPTTQQGVWLQNAMSSSDAEWKIVVFHHPPYSSTPGKSAQWMRWPFAAWGADLVLSGDAHVYERLRIDGLDYAISGLGVNHTPLDNPRIPGSQAFYSEDDAGALFITACTGALEMEYRALGAGLVDAVTLGTGSCP